MANLKHVEILSHGFRVWNQWRKNNLDIYPDLRQADLASLDLIYADLDHADLQFANLRGTELSNAILCKANLTGADLIRADLSDAIFTGAILDRANLSNANLRRAEFHNAILSGANISNADLSLTNFRRANLRNVDLSLTNLSYAILSNTDLHRANLHRANLRNVDLRNANLHRANLHRTNLRNASLSGANLSGANLSLTNLRNANLSGANLSLTNLRNAILDKTVLNEIICAATVFANVNLSTVNGLNTVRHFAPSTLGIDTLFQSKGKIPEIFLRGCGVPETLITFLLSKMEENILFYSCFISYSHADKEFAKQLYDRLREVGIRCWLDEHQLNPGDKLHPTIYEAIREYDKVILCCSESAIKSWWVEKELENAIAKEEDYQEMVLIPLSLDNYLFDESVHQWFVGEIKKRFTQRFDNWKDHDAFEQSFEKVVKALRMDGGKPPSPSPKLTKRK